jgi:mRNA-degrading endonuclease toxin of MazEF toxin-antitoxin module
MSLRDALKKAGVSNIAIRAGDVCIVKDESVVIPETPEDRRNYHKDGRLCVVLSNHSMCADPTFPIVSIAPLTHRIDLKDSCDCPLDPSPQNSLRERSLVMLGHIQPVTKQDLVKKIGTLSEDEWKDLLAHVLSNFDRS